MTIHRRDVFEELTPPPGGLDALRARLDMAESRPHAGARRLRWALASTAAGALVWLALATTPWSPRPHTLDPFRLAVTGADPSLVQLGLAQPPAAAVTVPPDRRHQIAVEEVPVAGSDVIFYRIAVLDDAPSRRSLRQP